ncbi:hypothetical protein D3C71_1174020 [compost metagenome]
MIGQQGAHPAVAPDDVLGAHRNAHEPVHRLEQIGLFVGAGLYLRRVAVVVGIGGANQGEVLFERNREHHALVGLLEQVRTVMGKQARHHQVAALHQPHSQRGIESRPFQHGTGPRPTGIDHAAGADALHVAVGGAQYGPPVIAVADQLFAAGACADVGAALMRIERVEHHQPGIVDARIGIGEAGPVAGLQCSAARIAPQVDALRAREMGSGVAKVVVEPQPRAQHPRRAQVACMRQHEAGRGDQMRCKQAQCFALVERLAHQRELALLQVAQAAMDQLGAGAGGMRGQVILLAQADRQAASCCVAGDAGAVDAAAHHQHVEGFAHRLPGADRSGPSSPQCRPPAGNAR